MNVNPWRRLGALLAALALAGALTPARAEVSESVAEQLMHMLAKMMAETGHRFAVASLDSRLRGIEGASGYPTVDMALEALEDELLARVLEPEVVQTGAIGRKRSCLWLPEPLAWL